ncbi:MAG TPA: hypothetical protein VJP59_00220 [Gemmatimonadota bacterium]|nr:hypothetical protein [Gemmatimonadota bacterium]
MIGADFIRDRLLWHGLMRPNEQTIRNRFGSDYRIVPAPGGGFQVLAGAGPDMPPEAVPAVRPDPSRMPPSSYGSVTIDGNDRIYVDAAPQPARRPRPRRRPRPPAGGGIILD